MKNLFPSVSFVYDRYKKADSHTVATVELKISHDRRQKYISTGIRIYPKQWRNGRIVNSPDARQLNQQLEQLMTDVRQVLNDMSAKGIMDIFSIPGRLEALRKGTVTLHDFTRERASIREYGKAEPTVRRYERFLRFFEAWGGMRDFGDITETNIIAFDKHLASTGMKPCSKWHNYHRFLNSFITDAIKEGLMTRNPYERVRIDKGGTDGLAKHLTPEEFKRIRTVRLSTKSLERVRDVFVFQTYTCLSYADLLDFNPESGYEETSTIIAKPFIYRGLAIFRFQICSIFAPFQADNCRFSGVQ